MVFIDTVYQRVLSIANKEQRGYITPLEFNLLANQAQLDIFEQYFYDKNQIERRPDNDTDYSDVTHILNEKISVFETRGFVASGTTLPDDLYRLGTILAIDGTNFYEAEYIDQKDWAYIRSSPLVRPTLTRPVYTRDSNGIMVFGAGNQQVLNVECVYVKQPHKVEWGYDVVAEKALYNASPNRTFNFEHHPSEETTLVLKILEIAGVILQDPGVIQYADQEELKKIQQEKQ